MNSRIFISTNYDYKLGLIYSHTDDQTKLNLLKKLFSVDMSGPKCLNDNKLVPITDNKSAKIIFLSDTLTIDKMDLTIYRDNDYLLHHNTIHQDIKQLFANSNRVQRMNSSVDDDLYRPVFDIIFFDSTLDIDSKLAKIVEKLGVQKEKDLKGKTNFLYYVYNGGKPKNYSLRKELSVEKYYTIFDTIQYDKLLDMIKADEKGEKQRENLIKLRDALLNQ